MDALLSRCFSDEALQRSGQMGLIEIAGLVNGVEDRNALP
jgi:hypothetical protein